MGGYQFGIGYGEPVPPPRINVQQELVGIFHNISDAATSHRFDLAHTITVAPLASTADLGLVCERLRHELNIDPDPVAKFSRRSDKKNYRSPGESDDAFMRAVVDRFRRLQFLDGTPYEEFVLLSRRDNRIVLVERRVPAGKTDPGRLLMAFVAVVAEPSGAVRNGRISPSLRKWIDGPTEISSPTTKRPF